MSTEDGSKQCTNWHSTTPSRSMAITSDKLALTGKELPLPLPLFPPTTIPPGKSLKLSSQSAISRCKSILRSCHNYYSDIGLIVSKDSYRPRLSQWCILFYRNLNHWRATWGYQVVLRISYFFTINYHSFFKFDSDVLNFLMKIPKSYYFANFLVTQFWSHWLLKSVKF